VVVVVVVVVAAAAAAAVVVVVVVVVVCNCLFLVLRHWIPMYVYGMFPTAIVCTLKI